MRVVQALSLKLRSLDEQIKQHGGKGLYDAKVVSVRKFSVAYMFAAGDETVSLFTLNEFQVCITHDGENRRCFVVFDATKGQYDLERVITSPSGERILMKSFLCFMFEEVVAKLRSLGFSLDETKVCDPSLFIDRKKKLSSQID